MDAENDSYNASKILVLEGVLGVRKRPGMYIGSTGAAGVIHLLYEVIDNAVDEAIAGFCKNIAVHLSQDAEGDIAEVSDDGRGIPVDMMEKYNKSALEVIMTTLHKGAKFNNDVYKVSGGLHGVGLTVVNALSEFTEVTVKRNGHTYRQSFCRGIPSTALETLGETTERGTNIKFKPDKEIFSVMTFDSTLIKDRLRNMTFLNPGIRIVLVDDRFGVHEEETFVSADGVKDFIRYINKDATTISSILHTKKQEGRRSFNSRCSTPIRTKKR